MKQTDLRKDGIYAVTYRLGNQTDPADPTLLRWTPEWPLHAEKQPPVHIGGKSRTVVHGMLLDAIKPGAPIGFDDWQPGPREVVLRQIVCEWDRHLHFMELARLVKLQEADRAKEARARHNALVGEMRAAMGPDAERFLPQWLTGGRHSGVVTTDQLRNMLLLAYRNGHVQAS